MRRVFRFGVIALLALAVVGNAALLGGIVVTKEPAPKALTGQRIETASRPAIVLIQSNYKVSTSVPDLVVSEASQKNIENQLLVMYYAGKISTEAQFQQAAINIILANPDLYFSAGPAISDSFGMVATGSGFFVTEDGYLVTAAHVVSADKSEIRSEVIVETKDSQYVATERDYVRKSFATSGLTVTDAQIDSLMSFYARWVEKYLTIDKIDVKYYIGTGNVEAGDRLVSTGARASVVSIDPTATGRDIAIVKADLNGVPTLPLSTALPHVGEATHAIGYPREGYLQESVPLNQTVKPTMTSGQVTVVTPQQNGSWNAWGTDAQFAHGASGGPVVDANGSVMGIVSFATIDATGKQLPGQGYFISSQYINEDLAKQSIKVATNPKNLTNSYYHALAEGDIQRYKTELVLLEDIQSRSPWDAYIKDDISTTQSQVLAGNDKTPPDLAAYLIPGATSAGGVILLALVIWLGMAITGRTRKLAPLEATPAPVPPETPPTPGDAQTSLST